MKIIDKSTESLIPYARNPRKNDQAVDAVAASIKEFGFKQPLVIDKDGVIVVGHTRAKAAHKLGIEKVPCLIADDLTEQQIKAYRILDNKIAEKAEWDYELLSLELDEIDLDLGPFDVDLSIPGSHDESEVTEDNYEPPDEIETKIELGDLIQLGKHRLLCGDSRNAESVTAIFGAEMAVLMNTDPPYGVGYVSNAKSKSQSTSYDDIENDELNGEALQEFLEDCIRAALPVLRKNAAFYLWHPMLTQGAFFAAAAAADILIHRQIIWVKPSLVFGRGDYHWKHELCFYGWCRGNRPAFYGERNQDTVWSIGRENDRIHPTQKPLELFAIPMRNHTKVGELVYEPFAGSGSQFIAAEQLGRRCYGLEINPKYCQVIIDRYGKYCEQNSKPFKCSINGESFNNSL